MTDVTTTDEPEQPAAPDAPAAAPAPAAALPAAPDAPVPFWHRPYVERYLVPLVLPLGVVVAIVVYVLNISRLFLSGHGHIPVIVGTIITVTILLGASLLSAAAPRLKQSAITLISVGFVVLIMSSGWLVLGHSQPKTEGTTTLAATLKTKQKVSITAAPGGAIAFSPTELKATTGLATINVTIAASGHTFTLRDSGTLFGQLLLEPPNSTKTGVAFFAAPGRYGFYCTTTGHDAAGMNGTIVVSGPPITLAQALTAAGNPPTAAG